MSEYLVLARKYRPQDFSTLIGQDVMVRTLKNAIDTGRLAHAFVLTGVRGVGKTTTARILAKGLNCTASDGPTVDPCGVCDACVSIADSSHVDVLEMDAASRTGIDDIREIIESVRYAPVSARYKVYIIDEVHMLSNQAFNGLLKTLEEPPAHVKFIFATTEIKKLPVTVLSRCQRFDLRRVEQDVLKKHLTDILAREDITADDDAVDLIVRAAEGSVRDSLSLLDQAIAHTGGKITHETVGAMLGYADRAHLLDLLKSLLGGAIASALDQFATLYDHGADPAQVISDLLSLSHELTRAKVSKAATQGDDQSDVSKAAIKTLADQVSIADLTRCWQVLLKGLGEVRTAPKPNIAAEMVMVRLAHASTLPDPASLIKQLQGPKGASDTPGGSADATTGAAGTRLGQATSGTVLNADTSTEVRGEAVSGEAGNILAFNAAVKKTDLAPNPISFEALVDLCQEMQEPMMANELKYRVIPGDFRVGHVAFTPLKNASKNLSHKLKIKLKEWTGTDWVVSLSSDSDGETLANRLNAQKAQDTEASKDHPLVKAVLDAFPGAEIKDIEKPRPPAHASLSAAADAWGDPDGVMAQDDYAVDDANDGGFSFADID